MKKLKKFLAVMISMVMVLSMATASFAEVGGTGSLTVTLANDNKLAENNKHTVKLYKLLNLESYDTSAKKYSYSLNDKYKQTIKDVLGNGTMQDNEIIGKISALGQDNTPNVQKFANDFETNYTGNPDSTGEIVAQKDKIINSVTINDLPVGYYLIVLDNAREVQANLFTVVQGTNNVKLKAEAPGITKSADKNDVEIGEIVTYTITTKIPKQLGDNMVYRISDTLSDGLDFVNYTDPYAKVTKGSLIIDIDGNTTQKEGITSIVGGKDGNNPRVLTIDLSEYIKNNQAQIGQTLTIKYKAKVNENAVIKTNNSATLEYGKNSKDTIVNKPVQVQTPTFPVHINKTDGKSPLAGAEFEIYHSNSNGDAIEGAAIKVTGNNGVYKIHTDQNAEINETVKTKMVTVSEINVDNFNKNGGYNLVINGLKAGTYWLRETKAPDGYNKLEKDIKITVTNNKDGSYTITSNSKVESNIVTIVNTSGAHLPETGGTGTLLLTAVGALLVAVAMIRFMRRKQEN